MVPELVAGSGQVSECFFGFQGLGAAAYQAGGCGRAPGRERHHQLSQAVVVLRSAEVYFVLGEDGS